MTDLTIYDPAMCCSTGVCGAEIDQRLVDFAADIDWLKSLGVGVRRINLSQEPAEFAENALVKAVLESAGTDGLPVILAGGALKSSGIYPDRSTLAQMAGISDAQAAAAPAASSGCCGGAKKAEESASSGGCCGGGEDAEETTQGCC